jgi:hypothetical protein
MKRFALLLALLLPFFIGFSQRTISSRTAPVRMDLQSESERSHEVTPNTSSTQIESIAPAPIPIPEKSLWVDIPVNPQTNDKTFAVVIANESYRREVDVPFAINDGKLFREYCEKTLGIPTRNIHYTENATFGEIRGAISWVSQVAEAYNGEARILFYYAGHGMPDESNQLPYLLPVDGFASDLETAISLSSLYTRFGALPAQNVTFFLDACFTGATREDGMLASARAVRVRPRANALQGNIVVFSSATGTETAHPYQDMEHGMFTYFLIKKLRETNGDVSYLELSDYLVENVKRRSIVVNHKSQTPQVNVSQQLQDQWQVLRLR